LPDLLSDPRHVDGPRGETNGQVYGIAECGILTGADLGHTTLGV